MKNYLDKLRRLYYCIPMMNERHGRKEQTMCNHNWQSTSYANETCTNCFQTRGKSNAPDSRKDETRETPTYRIEDYIVMKRAWPGCYRMYWIGTRNEVFPGMLFESRKMGLAYFAQNREQAR